MCLFLLSSIWIHFLSLPRCILSFNVFRGQVLTLAVALSSSKTTCHNYTPPPRELGLEPKVGKRRRTLFGNHSTLVFEAQFPDVSVQNRYSGILKDIENACALSIHCSLKLVGAALCGAVKSCKMCLQDLGHIIQCITPCDALRSSHA